MNSSSIAGMRILVTGAGGFLGSEISRQLLHEGCVVTGVGRGNYPDLIAAGIDMRRCDIRDSQELSAIASSHDAVIHTAAIAGVWGPWKQFYSINVEGTENVIRCCQEHGISKLIFTSSPSVTFDGGDQQNIRENVEYPSKWLAHYPHTKAIAEKAVLAANNATLATVALRPHLIWGPGDPHLIPRVLERGKRRRLKIIGDGDNKVDMVYVENAALAHICALKSLTANSAISGKSYWVTQQEPVKLWDWINEILSLAGLKPVRSKVSPKLAYRIGRKLEFVYRVLRIKSDPPMTRFVAKQLSTHHYFDNSASRDELRYIPRVTTEEGMTRLRGWIEQENFSE